MSLRRLPSPVFSVPAGGCLAAGASVGQRGIHPAEVSEAKESKNRAARVMWGRLGHQEGFAILHLKGKEQLQQAHLARWLILLSPLLSVSGIAVYFDREHRDFAGRENDGVFANVARFHADHLEVILGAEVG